MHLSCSPGWLFPLLITASVCGQSALNNSIPAPSAVPVAETLSYSIDWHMITAGTATLETARHDSAWQMQLRVQSAGSVARLYRVEDLYKVQMDSRLCPSNASFEAQEGHRHVISRLAFDEGRHRTSYQTQDLVKNITIRNELSVSPCTHEILTALTAMRRLQMEAGRSTSLAITNGAKATNARIDCQGPESVTIDGKAIRATRYEAFVFDNALFKRKGRLYVWISQDTAALPLQFRFEMGFPVGNVLLTLHSHKQL